MVIDKNLKQSYYDNAKEYALYVNMHRMIPAKDGFIPVQRRILYAALHNSGAINNIKSATVVGDTMGHYHPHGDSSIQGALYQLVNWFNTKVPLFDGTGTFGNTNGDAAAAMRYTEVCLSEFAQEVVLDELRQSKESVDWIKTYDNRHMEPAYLPVKVPLLLVNGSGNIAVGEKIDIPSHNLCDVIDQCIALIKNPNHQVVLIPDHCQKTEIINNDWRKISDQGGPYQIRGCVEVGEYEGDTKRYRGLPCVHIRSCPNSVYLKAVTEKLEELVKGNKIYGILDVEEHSSIDNMDYVIILKSGVDPYFIKDSLYKNTRLQTTCRVNMLVVDTLDNNNPIKRYNYTTYMKDWINFRRVTKHRFILNKVQKMSTEMNMLQNYIWSIESGKVDEALNIIKSAKKDADDTALVNLLIKKLGINDIQAEFFINCEVKKLAKSYLLKHKERFTKLSEEVNRLNQIVIDPRELDNAIIEELLYIRKKYGKPRQTVVISNEKDNIPAGKFTIIISKKEHRIIKKAGDDISIKNPEDIILIVDNTDTLLLFDEIGRVYPIQVYKIPFSGPTTKGGIDIRILNKYINTPIRSVLPKSQFELADQKTTYLTTITNQGYIKKMNIGDFLNCPNSGLTYSKAAPDDLIHSVFIHDDKNTRFQFIIASSNKAICLDSSEIPLLKRNSRGNQTILTNNGVIDFIGYIDKSKNYLLVGTQNGYLNKIEMSVLKMGKGRKGNKLINLGKTDRIADIASVDDNNVIDIISIPGPVISTSVKVSDIKNSSSVSSGTKIALGGKGNFISGFIVK